MPDSIRAKEFIVVDDAGRERAKLGSRNGEVSLQLCSDGGASALLTVDENGDACFEFRSGARTIRLLINKQRAQVKLKNGNRPESSCGFTLDAVGAWIFAESTPDIGVRMLSNHAGNGALVWLAEKATDRGDPIVRTRCVHPDPREDSTSGWQSPS